MSDAAQPTAAEVRAAAEAVKTALDRHLAAVERRTGKGAPTVNDAFNELAAAAEAYDELLFQRYDEVTPFDIPGAVAPFTGPEPEAISVLIRRDYTVVEPRRLVAQALRVEAVEEDEPGPEGTDESLGTARALDIVFGEFEADEIASRYKDFGLDEGDSTLWVTALDAPAEPGEWLENPFEQPDDERVVCRFDASTVFDEEADDDLDDEDDLRPGPVTAAVPGLDEDVDDEDLEPLDADR